MIWKILPDAMAQVARVYRVTRRTVWQVADPYHILLFIHEGTCTVELEGEEYHLREGDLLFIPQDSLYIRRPVENRLCTMYYAHVRLPVQEVTAAQARMELTAYKEQMDMALIEGKPLYDTACPLYLPLHSCLSAQKQEIDRLFQQATDCIAEASLYGAVSASMAVNSVLTLAAEQALDNLMKKSQISVDGKTPEQLRRAMLFIRRHCAEKISLADLSRACNVSRQQMMRYFRQHLQVTPNTYIAQYKMNKARELFMNAPQLSVKEVSVELGFDDPCYFSRVFARTTGETPTAYRSRIAAFDEAKHVRDADGAVNQKTAGK